jgi:hypothetical protein
MTQFLPILLFESDYKLKEALKFCGEMWGKLKILVIFTYIHYYRERSNAKCLDYKWKI